MRVSIYSLKEVVYEGEAEVLSLPTTEGEISVLENHVPLVTVLAPGKIRIRRGSGFDEDSKSFEITNGFAQINPKSAIVLTD
jgi:F-type H+-transporting ATPase subunit epsilon